MISSTNLVVLGWKKYIGGTQAAKLKC